MANNKLVEKDIKVGGMTCAMCVKHIEKSLSNLQGTDKVNVNLGSELAHVVFDPDKVKYEDMQKAIEDTGYQYLGIEGEEESNAEEEKKKN